MSLYRLYACVHINVAPLRMVTDRSRFDINAPVLKMLESAKAEDPNNFEDSFEAQVENYAPGLLALEAEGRLVNTTQRL